MPTATITNEGQLTLPEEVREHLHLAEGDRVEFVLHSEGEVHLRPLKGSVRELRGLAHRPGMPACTVEEMTENMAASIADDNQRILRGED